MPLEALAPPRPSTIEDHRVDATPVPEVASGSRVGSYLVLSKARLSGLVVLTAAAGFVLSSSGPTHWDRLVWTILGTALSAGGANALNQWMESDLDARMERTRSRPIPAGTLTRAHALRVGLVSAILGPVVLALFTNPLTAALAVLTTVLYLAVYTPLKRRSTTCTLAGAVCGAIPPLMGCAAAAGRLDGTAWLLFVLLFLWQIPHFLALAWLYQDDYARGGFRMFPLGDPRGTRTARLIVLYTFALLPLGFAMTLRGLGGWIFLAGSLLLGLAFAALGLRFSRERSSAHARHVFLASLAYLPLVLSLLVLDRGPASGLALLHPGSFSVGPPIDAPGQPLDR